VVNILSIGSITLNKAPQTFLHFAGSFFDPLLTVCCLPLVTAFALNLVPSTRYKEIRSFVLGSSVLTCFWSQYRLIYSPFIVGSGGTSIYSWLTHYSDPVRIPFALGVDGISLFFILLTTLIFPFCFLSLYKKKGCLKLYCMCFLVLEGFLLFAFSVGDLLFFYVFFEAVLVPMFFIIGLWGSGYERIRAAYYFFFFTSIGSLFFLLAILSVYTTTGSTLFYVVLNSDYLD
jgi:NADH:ubiquinone oxidoreductase subunit 4 (subunit M)